MTTIKNYQEHYENSKTPYSNLITHTARKATSPDKHLKAPHPFASPFLAVLATSPVYHIINTTTHGMQMTERSTRETISMLLKDGGIRRLYRGYGPAIINSAVGKGISFGTTGALLDAIPEEKQTFLYKLSVTTCSVLLKLLICLPFDKVKLCLQIGHLGTATTENQAIIATAKYIYKKYGLLGFYRCFPISTTKSFFAQAPYLMVYYGIKDDLPIESPLVRHTLTGVLSGGATLITTLPFDHIKTNVLGNSIYSNQSNLAATKEYLRKSIQKEGIFRTTIKLYHSSIPAVSQIVIGGVSIALGIHFFNELLDIIEGKKNP